MTDYISNLLEVAGCSALDIAKRILDGAECVPDCVSDGPIRAAIAIDEFSVNCERIAFLFLCECGATAGEAIGLAIKENVVARAF